jgi:hypothetical protein
MSGSLATAQVYPSPVSPRSRRFAWRAAALLHLHLAAVDHAGAMV